MLRKVLSKVVGKTVGVAKKAKVVCVKGPGDADRIAIVISFWKAILQDAIDKQKANPDQNVIINYSQHCMESTTFFCRQTYADQT
jgi:hypothetical protein